MQHPRSETHTPRENDDCEILAPFVMALFDGEADGLEARRARAHLLVCQRCARCWLDWNRSRDLLRSVPVPAPPPTLLWRVLMACRLAAFARRRRFHLGFHLGDSLGLTAARTEKSGSQFAPRDLSAQILARTTRVQASSSHQPKRRVFPILALPSLAVPALTLWLIALQGSTPWVAAPPQSPPADAAPSSVTAPRRVKASAPSPSAPRRAAISPTRKLAVNSSVSALTPAPRRTAATLPKAASAPLESPQRETQTAPAAPASVVRAAPRVVAIALSTAPAPARSAAARPVTAIRVTPSKERGAPQFSSSPRPAALSASRNAPQLRAARWKISAPRLVAAVEKMAPDALPSRVSAPTPPAPEPPRLLAENFEDDDEGVEEMRSVVDDFRAALDPDGFQTIDFESDAG